MINDLNPDSPNGSNARWRKSRRSMTGENNCVEVRFEGDEVHVRDSKNPTEPHLALTVGQWASLLTMIKNS